MKKYFIFLFVVFTLALSSVSAFAFNSETDTVFTCDSNPADFNGKTFENLYVLLNGCTNFDSTIIPGEDAFVTLRDITVTGRLYYGDDTYDRATNTYRDASVGEETTHIDHYLNLAGQSTIISLYMVCENPHDCNLGIDRNSIVQVLTIAPSNDFSRGRMFVRGNIDPFVDEETDYYHDTIVKNHPDFTDIETYDFKVAESAKKDVLQFLMDTLTVRAMGVDGNHRLRNAILSTFYQGMISEDAFKLLHRGASEYIVLRNTYEIENLGETELYLCNFNAGVMSIDNANWNNTIGDYVDTGIKIGSWVPNIKSRGYTTIASLISTIPFKTSADTNSIYTATSSDDTKGVLPLYIDVMTLGREGETLTYDMDLTVISMLNFVGNENAASVLDLNMGDMGDKLNSPQIGIANIIGGMFDWSSTQTRMEMNSIKKMNLYEGLLHYKLPSTNAVTIENTLYKTYTKVEKGGDVLTFITDNDAPDSKSQILYNKRYALFEREMMSDEGDFLYVLPKSTTGYFLLVKCLDDYLHPGDVDMTGTSVTKLKTMNVSFGDMNVSKNLGTGANLFDPSCHLYQNGSASSFNFSTIE